MTVVAPKRWTREEYYRLADLGFFEGQRVELLFGEIVRVSPQKKAHALVIGRLNTILVRLYGDTHVVRIQLPLDVNNESQPEPDLAIVPISLVEESEPHPPTADLVIEVSETSLSHDRSEKARLYASAGIPQYWILNLVDRVLEVHAEPSAELGYRTRKVLTADEVVLLPGTRSEFSASQVLP